MDDRKYPKCDSKRVSLEGQKNSEQKLHVKNIERDIVAAHATKKSPEVRKGTTAFEPRR